MGIVSFALMSILGVMSMTLVAHRDSSTDSIFSIMTETAVQEVHNYNSPATFLTSGTYNFTNKLLPAPRQQTIQLLPVELSRPISCSIPASFAR